MKCRCQNLKVNKRKVSIFVECRELRLLVFSSKFYKIFSNYESFRYMEHIEKKIVYIEKTIFLDKEKQYPKLHLKNLLKNYRSAIQKILLLMRIILCHITLAKSELKSLKKKNELKKLFVKHHISFLNLNKLYFV